MKIAPAFGAFLLLAGCAPAPVWQFEQGVVWCYRTLAAPDCYSRPLAGAERRQIAAGPEVFFTPAAASATDSE
jgi:hypothetical protein